MRRSAPTVIGHKPRASSGASLTLGSSRPLRIAVVVLAAAVSLLAAPAANAAEPAKAMKAGNAAERAKAGTVLCTIDDPRAVELSGLVATSTGYVAIDDSRDDASEMRIFYIDSACKVTKTLGYPSPARDPEDLAQAPDGTLWVADIGDNFNAQNRRSTIALWQIPKSGGAPVIYRLTYPDGPHDAEALFFTPDGVPVIVTKEPKGIAGLYEPSTTMVPRTTNGVPLKRVGEFTAVSMGFVNPLSVVGELLVTGAATSPDRKRVALRTYAAAYEWDVPDGDPVKAITTTPARVTPLPDEPQGESIAYTVDGRAFLTVSDEAGPTTLRRYLPGATIAGKASTASPTPSPSAKAAPAFIRAINSIPLWAMLTIGVAGFGVAAAGVFGLFRGRRRSDDEADDQAGDQVGAEQADNDQPGNEQGDDQEQASDEKQQRLKPR